MPEFVKLVTVEEEVPVDFEIWCNRWGAGLCHTVTERHYYSGRADAGFEIEPRENCLKAEGSSEYNRGYEEGYEEGKALHSDD